MPVVRVASPKGGVGKTTLAATLGVGLRRIGPSRMGYVFNQIEPRRRLCRDVLALAHEVLGETLFGTVHHDEAVAEAVACQMTVLDYAPDSVAAHDMAVVANRVHDSLAPAA